MSLETTIFTRKKLAIFVLAGLLGTGCAREEGVGGANGNIIDAEDQTGEVDPRLLAESTVEIPVGTVWKNTGIRVHNGQRITLAAKDASGNPPVGNPVADRQAPVPMFGEDGLIGRVGEDGFPFAIGKLYEVQGSSLTEGEHLFLGRNLAAAQPFDQTATAAAGATTNENLAAEIVAIPYEETDYTVDVTIRQTDGPALLTPIDGFFDANPNPIFDWDEIDNASQYNLDISDFPDFRRVLFSVNVASTSINTATLQIDANNPSAPVNPNLDEGVYYWRVRAQINDGRLLNPNLMWTDRSIPFRIGVETLENLPAPEILTPSGQISVAENAVIPFEILAVPDASGLQWRYRFFRAACGEVIDPSTGDLVAEVGSPWLLFQQTFRSNRIDQPERLYAAFASPVLRTGSWLVRIETRDRLDQNQARLGITDYEFEAGCN